MSMGVAVVGCGTISHEYLRNLATFPDLQVLVCSDVDTDRAKRVAEQYGVPDAGPVDSALAHPGVDLVVNLTVPAAHVPVSIAALEAGKHVYTEKPLSLDVSTGQALLATADSAGLRVGAAPDTFLGAGLQTACRLVAGGAIGVAQSGLALLTGPGPESWHSNPEFLYAPGGGPLFDMAPYHLTALTTVLGPVAAVIAGVRQARAERTIGSGPRAGTRFPVQVPTHVSAVLEFARGPMITAVFSFDSPVQHDLFELTGTDASLTMPNPNAFDGSPLLRRAGEPEWTPIPERGPTVGRGLGVLDMVRAIRTGVPHRATGAQALHVVEVMTAIVEAARSGASVMVRSTFAAVEPLPLDWDPHTRTLS
jgi:predicted dehydrogenase